MPPRYAYWTIIVDDQPTAFRAGAKEDLLPTFNRLQSKHASAKMMWFQNGKLWDSRIDAQEAMRARGEMGRRGDERQLGRRSFSEGGGEGFRDRKRPASTHIAAGFSRPTDRREKPEWKPKSSSPQASRPARTEKPEWKPKGKNVGVHFSAPRGERKDHREKIEWRPKGSAPDRRPARDAKPEWRPKGQAVGRPFTGRRDDRKDQRFSRPQDPKTSGPRNHRDKLEWRPKGEGTPQARSPQARKPSDSPEKRKWVPKEEYKKSQGIEVKRDSKWRPGGEHKDPRQKYKDAKKAKWTRFKQTVRKRWEGKRTKKKGD